jgi:hypothetical protein
MKKLKKPTNIKKTQKIHKQLFFFTSSHAKSEMSDSKKKLKLFFCK